MTHRLLLLALLGWIWIQTEPLRAGIAALPAAAYSSEDFLRDPRMLGAEYPVYAALLADFPTGTAVDLPPDESQVERVQRFWLALLPEYPIRSGAELCICPADELDPQDRVLARGKFFALVDRRGEIGDASSGPGP